MQENISKLAFADELLKKLGNSEVEILQEDFNLLKALIMGMQFQAGNVRHQLSVLLDQLVVSEGKTEIPAKK